MCLRLASKDPVLTLVVFMIDGKDRDAFNDCIAGSLKRKVSNTIAKKLGLDRPSLASWQWYLELSNVENLWCTIHNPCNTYSGWQYRLITLYIMLAKWSTVFGKSRSLSVWPRLNMIDTCCHWRIEFVRRRIESDYILKDTILYLTVYLNIAGLKTIW